MNLTPREKDKLLVSVAAIVAERRLRRGVKLNHPEAVALITDYVLEGARDGKTVAELDGARMSEASIMDAIAYGSGEESVLAEAVDAKEGQP